MLQIIYGLFFFIYTVSLSTGYGQTIWGGPKMVFEKADSVDWSLEENQDRITDSVWITRQNNQGIFNIRLESSFNRENRTSPLGTEWANGKIEDGLENLSFTTWQASKLNSSSLEVGVDKVLHLLSEDIYLDIKFLSWTAGGGGSGTGLGGGFSYERSTPIISSNETSLAKNDLQVIQLHDQLELRSDEKITKVLVITIAGKIIYRDNLFNSNTENKISIKNFPSGMYIILVDQKYWVKFIKV